MTEAPLLRVMGLSRSFGAVTALDNVDLEVAAGEVLALLGENGAGKSTLVEILAGRLTPHGGTMEIDGAPYRPRDPRLARRRRVAVVHQHFQLIEAFTVAENLRLIGARQSEIAGRWHDLEDRLDLRLPPLQTAVRDLGVGERQWLEIGKSLLFDPRLLLLDEATAVLTPSESANLFDVVARIADSGTGVVFITHRLDEVEAVAHRTVILRGGRVVFDGSPSAPDHLAEMMTGRLPDPPAPPEHRPGEIVARLTGVALPPRLRPVDLEFASGAITVLAGVDGNGQVAVAERLAGLADGPGRIEIDGRPAGGSRHALQNLGVALIPGDRTRFGIVPSLSVAENLFLGKPGSSLTLSRRQLEAQATRVIAELDVKARPDQPVGELSGGNQQKIVVARALSHDPRILVAIHPTRGLDVVARRTVHDALFLAAARGVAVLVVTSDLEEARLIGDRILVFSRGRVVGEGGRDTASATIAAWVGGDAA